jgi:hypothetical protein
MVIRISDPSNEIASLQNFTDYSPLSQLFPLSLTPPTPFLAFSLIAGLLFHEALFDVQAPWQSIKSMFGRIEASFPTPLLHPDLRARVALEAHPMLGARAWPVGRGAQRERQTVT